MLIVFWWRRWQSARNYSSVRSKPFREQNGNIGGLKEKGQPQSPKRTLGTEYGLAGWWAMDGQGDRPMDKPTLERHPRGCSCVGSVQHSGAKSCTPLFVQMLIASTREPFISVGAILSPRVRV